MRISATLMQKFKQDVMLGYYTPHWHIPDSGWPTSMMEIVEPMDDGDWNDDIEYHINSWASFVEERNGSIEFVKFIQKWFNTEDIIYYKFALDDDGTNLLSYQNYARGCRVKIKPGKFLGKEFNRSTSISRQFAEEWADMILELKDVYKNYSVTTISDTDEIISEYRSMHGTDLSSCCTHSARDYATGGVHPCVVYGGDSGVNLVVLRDENDIMFSRTLIYNGKYIRIYPAGHNFKESVTRGVLTLNGIAGVQGTLKGAKLNYVENPEHEGMVVCPYLDGNAHKVAIGERGNGDPCLDVFTGSGRGCDTQNDCMHEYACFNADTYRAFHSRYAYSCCNCDSGFHEDSDYAVYTDEGNHYCCEDCTVQAGNVLAIVGSRGTLLWMQERYNTLFYYNNSYYTSDGLEGNNLVLCHDDEVRPEEDCVLTSHGYYPSVDCLFVNTPQEYQDAPTDMSPVWMLNDGSGEVGIGSLETFLTETGQHRSLLEQSTGES